MADDHHSTAAFSEEFRKELYLRAVEASPVGIAAITWGDFRFVAANQAFADMLGHPTEEILGRANTAFLHPDQMAADAAIKAAITAGEPVPASIVRQMQHRDGSTIWAEVHPVRVQTAEGLDLVASIYIDVTERRKAEAERDALAAQVARSLARQEYLFAEAVTNSVVGHAVLARDTRKYLSVNAAFAQMLGYEIEQIVGRRNSDFVPSEQLAEDAEARRHIEDGEPLPPVSRRRYQHRDGHVIWLDVHPTPVNDENGRPVVVSQYIDVTEVVHAQAARAAAEAESERILADLQHRSTHDLLTGLHNRHALIADIERRLQQGSACFAVLYLDLDNFKHVNDAYSHDAGDRVLARFSTLLRRALRAEDDCGRIGGDEFVVVADGVDTLDDAVAVAQRLQTIMSGASVAVGRATFTPRFSVGISLSRPGALAHTLLQEADAALRTSKTRGKNRWEVYEDSTRLEATRRLTVARDLQQGLLLGHVHAHYQPIVEIASRRVVGYEALARWWHGERWVAAGEWIGIADEAGLLLDVGERMVAESIARLAQLPQPLTIALNGSADELSHPRFTQWIDECLSGGGADPARLVVEVTEQSLLNAPESTKRHLSHLVRQGVQVHLDDFGTGYSSITHLRELPITGIKLDRSFTHSFGPTASAHDEIVPALAKLAAHLGLTTIAEGVESEAQAAALVDAGWNLGQGYLFGRPGPFPGEAEVPDPPPVAPPDGVAQPPVRRTRDAYYPVTGRTRRRGDSDEG